jgi:hypothetical protein
MAGEKREKQPSAEWVVTREWVQVAGGEGMYIWQLLRVPGMERLGYGVAATKLGVRWQAWRARRRLGLHGRINARGTVA